MTVLASKYDILGEHKQFFQPNLTASVSGKSHRVILVDTRVDICISARFNVKVHCPKPNPPIFTMCVSFFGTRNTRLYDRPGFILDAPLNKSAIVLDMRICDTTSRPLQRCQYTRDMRSARLQPLQRSHRQTKTRVDELFRALVTQAQGDATKA